MAFTNGNDINILQGSDSAIVGAGLGDDIYIVSPVTLTADQEVTISDNDGTNTLQLIGGLTIASSLVVSNALQLTLSNGAIINVEGADSFNFNIGGNAVTGDAGEDKDFSTFAQEDLGVTVPAAGEDPVAGDEVVIGDVTPEVPTFSVETADVSEGETATFTVTLSEAAAEETTVDYTVSYEGDASADDIDLADLTGTLTFAAGETTATVEVPVIEDALSPEDGEGITLTLSNATGADAEIGVEAATANITDVPLTFELTQGAASVQEGNTVTYTLTASAPVLEDTEVEFSVVPGDATAANQGTNDTNLNDFSEGSFNPSIETIAAGETTVQFELTTDTDGITELPEGFTMQAVVNGETYTIDTTLLDGGGAGQTFNLTSGIDDGPDYTGGVYDDTFIAGDGTFTSFDDLDGGDGNDVLRVTEIGADLTTANKSVENIESARLQGDQAVTADTTGWTGLTSLNIAAAMDSVDVDAADTTAVIVDSVVVTADAANTLDIDGGSSVTISNVKMEATTADALTVDGKAITEVSLTDVDLGVNGDLTITDTSTDEDVLLTVTLDTVVATDTADDGDIDITGDLTTLNLIDGQESVTLDSNAGTRTLTVNLDGYNSGTVTDAQATTLNINSSGGGAGNDEDGKAVGAAAIVAAAATSVSVDVADNDASLDLDLAAATELTVTGDSELSITGTDILDLTDVTVTGAAGIKVDLSAASVESLNMAGTSGDNTISDFDAATVDFAIVGGSGDDHITTSGALDDGASVDLGAGDDTFIIDTAPTTGGSSSVEGGDDIDTLGLTNAAFADTSVEADIFSGFETLEVGGGQGSYQLDLLGLTDIKISADINAAGVTLDDAAAGAEITATATASTDLDITTGAVAFVLADPSGDSDVATLNMNAVDGDDDGTTTEGEVTIADFTADDIETVVINSNATTVDADDDTTPATDESTTTDEYINTVTLLNGSAMETLELNGNAQAVVTVGGDDGSAGSAVNTIVTFVDASGNTAGVTVDMSAVDDDGVGNANVMVNTAAVTFKGSDADDTYSASHNGDTIQGNGGADTINLSDNADQATGALVLDTPTNADETVRFVAVSDSQLVFTDTSDPADGTANVADGFDRIVDFNTAGTDLIELSSALGLATGDARAAVLQKGVIAGGDDDLTDGGTGAAALETFIDDGVDFFDTGLVDRAVAVADNGTDTFVFVDANSDGNFTAADDMTIVLSGVVAIDVTDITFG